MAPVLISRRAVGDVQRAHDWWAEHRSAEQAARWYDGLMRAIHRLSAKSLEYPLANESEGVAIEIREMLFGLGRRPTHRVLFIIRPESILILCVRHVAQDVVPPDELF